MSFNYDNERSNYIIIQNNNGNNIYSNKINMKDYKDLLQLYRQETW